MEWLDSIPITDEEADASTKSKHRRPMDDLPNIQYDVRCFSESTCKVSEGEEMTRQKNNCDYLYFLQDYASALDSYRQFQERWQKKLKGKDKSDIIESIACCLFQLSEYKDALEMLSELVSEGGGCETNFQVWFTVAKLHKKLSGISDIYRDALQKSLSLNTKNFLAWFKLGRYYMSCSEWYFCSKCLSRARYLAIDSGFANVARNRNHARIVDNLEKFIQACADHPDEQIPRTPSEFEDKYLVHLTPHEVEEDNFEERDPSKM